ncbi:FMN-binding negative transcriptional regulator [Vibrio rumoiensis]|uniref:FMN-binding negative transcriptional regulator n=1 Tax=Vibrio rumoiensis TaxID=76258 RepID=UPI000B5CE794|nr:FMN-binding negative transcriptional regulator [Vibrio rumoiensis]
MHKLKVFQQTDTEHLYKIIHDYPFATLILSNASGIEVDHLPMILAIDDGVATLQGHIAKANPLARLVNDETKATIIFHGPNCYISPNYYPTKKENGKAVPTWNYIVVHVTGAIKCINDSVWKLGFLNRLTNKHESNSDEPWSISDAPQEYIEKMLPVIVGLEVQIESIEGKWKVSQDKPEINQKGVVEGLQVVGHSEMQAWVQKFIVSG